MNTTYFLNLVMGNLFHTIADPAIPDGYYIGLSSTAPTVDGVCDGEPSSSGTGYARVKLNYLSEPDNGVIHNISTISFPESTSNWGVMTHYVVYDAETEGNLLFYGELAVSRSIEADTVLTIRANELSITLSNASA